ncbi:hypothetical protein F7O43_01625 [Neisseria meningitidis]|nr:hypothetical protein [Neisseria meningitidis]MBG8947287.1 hypothetical protein [Neisseria meningitidis]MCI3176584.1 hypothetical protein [Neisseria meningitidis]TYR46399.1 hypothetical protein FY520_00570 [Neisseria meningitidis]
MPKQRFSVRISGYFHVAPDIRTHRCLFRRHFYSGLNLNQDKARQRRTGLNLIHYKTYRSALKTIQ